MRADLTVPAATTLVDTGLSRLARSVNCRRTPTVARSEDGPSPSVGGEEQHAWQMCLAGHLAVGQLAASQLDAEELSRAGAPPQACGVSWARADPLVRAMHGERVVDEVVAARPPGQLRFLRCDASRLHHGDGSVEPQAGDPGEAPGPHAVGFETCTARASCLYFDGCGTWQLCTLGLTPR